MAHDGNIQRDTGPRPPEPGDGDRPSASTAPKPVLPAEGPPHPSEGKPLPRFNSIPRAGEAKAAGPRPAETKKAPASIASPSIPLPPRPKAERAPTPSASTKPASPLAWPVKETGAAAEPPLKAGSDGEATRRAAKRRTAAPPRARIAANDDAPSIGGLIFALQQKPSNRPFMFAATGSGGWLAVGSLLAWAMLAPEISRSGFFAALASPTMIIVAATICLPIALFWFLALLTWRAQELKLMSSAMTEVAVRLAEPDRAAEQAAASLGQAVRRQVSFMNEAISRALGRAGELEGLVHNEVASLEKSYGENEHKIRGLIQELAGERHALVSTTDKVSDTLKAMGGEVPMLIEKLSAQQVKLAKIIEGAGQNLIALENQLATASGGLETTLDNRTRSCRPCSTTTRWRSIRRWQAALRRSTSSWWSARAHSTPHSRSGCRASTMPWCARPWPSMRRWPRRPARSRMPWRTTCGRCPIRWASRLTISTNR
jgi:hypothetical protein